MKSSASTVILSCLAFAAPLAAQVGKIWPSEKQTWIDPEFGREITQWTRHEKPSWHLYFNVESFIDANHAIIVSERSGQRELYRLSLETGEMLQMTASGDPVGHLWHWPALHTLWFTSGAELAALDTRTLERRVITRLSKRLSGLSATCDGRWVLASWNKSETEDRYGPFAVFRIDAQTGETVQISPDHGFNVNHLQASPVDPAIMTHAWQHLYAPGPMRGTVGNTPVRIWWLRVDGTDGGPLTQEFGIHRTHEFWFPGEHRLGYAARYFFGPNRGRAFLGSCLPDGSNNTMMELPVGPSHPMVFEGGRYWIADLFEGQKILTLSETKDYRIVKTEKLFRHDSSWEGQPSHPHVRISPDGRLVLFGTDRTGTPQVHSVRLDLGRSSQ